MDFDVKKIFFPSVGVNLVFNINTDFPILKSSIIYDADFKKQTITIAQPSIPVTPNTPFEQLHLTTLVYINQHRLRIGVRCRPIQFIRNFPMGRRGRRPHDRSDCASIPVTGRRNQYTVGVQASDDRRQICGKGQDSL